MKSFFLLLGVLVITLLSSCGGIVDNSNDANSSGYINPTEVLTKNIWAQLSSGNDRSGWKVSETPEFWDNAFMFRHATNDSLLVQYLELEIYNAKDTTKPIETKVLEELLENEIFILRDTLCFLDSTDCDTVYNITDSTFQGTFYNDIFVTLKYKLVWDTLKLMSINLSETTNELDTTYSMWIRLENYKIRTFSEDSLQNY